MFDSRSSLTIIALLMFVISQGFALTASFITIPYKNLTVWEAYKMAIPFVWIDWIFLTFAVFLTHKYKLMSIDQIVFLIIIIQFIFVLIGNKFYLKKKIYTSDYVAIIVLIGGYSISQLGLFTKYFSNPGRIEKKKE